VVADEQVKTVSKRLSGIEVDASEHRARIAGAMNKKSSAICVAVGVGAARQVRLVRQSNVVRRGAGLGRVGRTRNRQTRVAIISESL